ncbi:MAG TPA: TolC family protein [Candidatus Acidoferrales bacterium]|nr:TolC family protein [Candidatus Acidoferrales bacterium]
MPLKHAVELALSHSAVAAMASADERKADAAYREARNAYVPQFVLGSGLGKSWGFPLSLEGAAPSVLNFNTQSALFNPSLQQFMHAAHTEITSAKLQAKDRREQVVQDTVLSYLELTRWQQQIEQLRQEEADSLRTEQAVEARIKEGVDSATERTKAKLVTARAKLRIAEAQGSADVLRLKLANLTGLPASTIEIVADSIPSLPSVEADDDAAARAAASNPSVKSAEEHALAQQLRARGEHRALWPSIDFAGQYALLSKYNNYDQFFTTFERHNGTVGVVMRLPFLNFSQKARAEGADADAIKAKQEARAAKDQVSAETLRLQRSVQQLAAAREVADLEYQVAQSGLEAAQTRVQANTGTFHEVEDARTQARERRNAMMDVDLQLSRARISLLRATGDLEKWANAAN